MLGRMAVTKGIDSARHRLERRGIADEGLRLANQPERICGHQPGGTGLDGFWALAGIAHHEYRLA